LTYNQPEAFLSYYRHHPHKIQILHVKYINIITYKQILRKTCLTLN